LRAHSRQDLIAAGLPEEKAEAIGNRKQVRQYRLSTAKKAGHRTGTTPHFERWKAEGALKSALQRTKTAHLADRIEDNDRAASGFALLFLAGYKNVWDLAQAKRSDLLKAKGVGLVTLGYVEEYLKAQKVELAWSAAS
jgi:hypothetical protein